MRLELINEVEVQVAFNIIEKAKVFLKENKIDQWQNGYPNIEGVYSDYKNQTGYLMKDDKENCIAYVSISLEKDLPYEASNEWKCNNTYSSAHRVVIDTDYHGKGYAKDLFRLILEKSKELGVHCVRIDTHPDNKAMIHVIEKSGFIRRGNVMVSDGLRYAFEYCLSDTDE